MILIIAGLIVAILLLNSNGNDQIESLKISEILNGTFNAEVINPLWSDDGKSFIYEMTENSHRLIIKYDVEKFEQKVVLNATSDLKINGESYASSFKKFVISADQTLFLFAVNVTKQWRSSFFANWIVYNSKNKESYSLIKYKISNPQWVPLSSPELDTLSFIMTGNIWMAKKVASSKTLQLKQITSDGNDLVLNGIMDWLYEEEVFESSSSFYWSPSGLEIAYIKINDTNVGTSTYPWYNSDIKQDPYSSTKHVKYPKAGTTNPSVSVFVYNTLLELTVKMDLTQDFEYVTTVSWIKQRPGQLAIRVLPRLQQIETILINDISTGSILLTHISQNMSMYGWVESRPYSFIFINSTHFIDIRENQGYYHIAIQNLGSKSQPKFITSGKFDVLYICGFDLKSQTIFYLSSEKSATQNQFYSVSIDGIVNHLTKNLAQATFSCNFGSDSSYLLTGSSLSQPPTQWLIKKSDFNSLKVIQDNTQLESLLEGYNIPKKEFISIPVGESSMNAIMIYPFDFSSDNIYPILFTLYGGPTSIKAADKWTLGFEEWISSDLQMLVCLIDVTGTAGRGVIFNQKVYKQLGTLETIDQIESIQWVLNSNNYIDSNRVALWGWSYGGYMTLNIMMNSPYLLKAAVSVAPVTDWLLYDTFYTERYMTTPKNNPSGYNSTSILNMVNKIGKNALDQTGLLIVHGMADDNVHFQNSALLVSQMVELDFPFSSYYYPNQDHSINTHGSKLQLYHSIEDFLYENVVLYSQSMKIHKRF